MATIVQSQPAAVVFTPSFFGAELTQVFARRYSSRIQPKDYATPTGEKTDNL